MNRREFIPASARVSLAAVALAGSVPAVFAQDRKCPSTCTPPPPGWKEDETTKHLEAVIPPPLSKVKANKDVHALTAGEWDDVADKFQALADEHSRLSNLHRLDLVVAANQVVLRKKYGSAAVDDLLKNGSHATFTNAATKYHGVATKLRGASPDFNMSCDKAYAVMVVELDITAMVLSEVPPIAIALGLCSVAMGIAGIFMCP